MTHGRVAAIALMVLVQTRPGYAADEDDPWSKADMDSQPETAPRTPAGSATEAERAPEADPIPAAVAPSPEGDIVETIELDGTRAAAAPAAPSPHTHERFELHGWARQILELGFSDDTFHDAEPDATALPYDRLVSRSQLFIRARYSRARWFEAGVSGALSYALLEQGPDRASTPFNGFNGQSVRGVLEPRLHELYLGFFTRALDVRIGQQRLAWGKGDFMSPNDVVNARDLRDPFVSETELRTIPTFMLRADLDLGFATLQGVAAPVFVPDRFDLYGSNWAAIQPDAPAWSRGLVNLVRRSISPTLQEAAQPALVATSYPDSDLSDPVLGARFSWSAGSFDVNYYYQYGFDGPLIEVDPAFGQGLAAIDFDTAGLVALEPWLAAIDAGQRPLRATYVRRHHVGTDLSTTLGPFALRLDGAYQSQRVFFARDLLGVVTPTLQGVASIEYQTGDKDKILLVEGIYVRVLDNPPKPLLIYELDSGAIALDIRWPIWEPLVFEVRALFGIEPRTALIQPELDLTFEPVVVSVGGLWLDGEPYSLGRYFDRNREIYVKGKAYF